MSSMKCEVQELRNIVTLEKGKPPVQQPYFGQDAELYLTPEYLRGKTSAELVKPSANAVRVVDGDTIVLWDGSNAGEFFKARRGILASTMSRIRHNDTFDKEYFFYAVKSWESYLKGQTSGSGIPHVDKEVLGKLEIFQFSKPEQSKIAEILSTVDRAIEQTEALIAKQQRIKIGLMQDLLTRGIDEHGNLRSEQTHDFKDSPLGRIPVGWEVQPCIALCREIVVGIVIRPMQYYRPDGVPVLRSANVKENRITSEALVFMSDKDNEKLLKSRLRKGDLVTVRTGYPGTTGVIPPELDGSNCVDIVISRPNHEKVRSEFLSIWINSDHGKRQVLEGQGGLAQQHFNVGEMRTLLVKVPDINEQKIIENLLILQSSAIDKLVENQQKLRSLKTALMQDLLTGKKRVTALLDTSGAICNFLKMN
jgi:type I restriction enzyme, S subunit